MQIQPGRALLVILLLASAGALATGCGSDGGSGGAGAGGAGVGGSSATGGQGGATGGTGGATGGAGGTAGSSVGGGAGSGGAAGAAGAGGAPPMCSTSAECKDAEVSFPGSTDPATTTPTECVGGQCGLVTSYSGSYKSPKPPRTCTDICAASTYDGQAMVCSASCQKVTVNGFGDQGLVYGGDAGPGTVAGLVKYQFSPLSGGYKFLEVGCAETPKSKLIQGSNSYTYVSHRCCCVAP